MKREETLEQEFNDIMNKHKCLIIASTIYAYEDEIINNQLFRDVLAKTKKDENEEFHMDITRRIVEYTHKYDSERLNKIYDLCWEKSKEFLPDEEAFGKDDFEDWDI